MEKSPEVQPVENEIKELLLQHDPDPYGYVAQAASIFDRWRNQTGYMSYRIEEDRQEYVMPIAEYASETGDSALLQRCMSALPEAAQWRVFARDACGNQTMEPESITKLGDRLAKLESKPEHERDYKTLVDIYASQLEIAVRSGSYDVEILRQNIAAITENIPNVNTGNINRRVSEALAHVKTEEVEVAETDARNSLWRRLFRRAIMPESQVLQGSMEPDASTALHGNSIILAQDRYAEALTNAGQSEAKHMKMALQLNQYAGAETQSDMSDEVETVIAGYRKLADLIQDGTTLDVVGGIGARQDLELRLQEACGLIADMPVSSKRIELTLEVRGLQQTLLPNSNTLEEATRQVAFTSWDVIRRTMTDANKYNSKTDIKDCLPEVQQLDEEFRKLRLGFMLRDHLNEHDWEQLWEFVAERNEENRKRREP